MRILGVMAVVAALSLGACATPKFPSAMGGSKADGSVTMGFNYNYMEKPVVDWNQTKLEAERKCKAWGYESAEAFGGQKTTCNNRDCTDKYVAMDYQCLGGQASKN